MPLKRLLTVALALALALGYAHHAAAQKKFPLTIDNIMRGPQLYGYTPTAVRWSGDSQKIYFSWKQAADEPTAPMDTYVVNRDGSGLKKLSEEEARLAPPERGRATRDQMRKVYTRDGDLFLYDFSKDTARQLTKTVDAESHPHFTQDEKGVAFTRGSNLYVLRLDSGMVEQLTDIKTSPAAPEPKLTESQEFLKKQEKELLAIVQQRTKNKEDEEARKKRLNPRKAFQLESKQSVSRLDLCPDQTCVIAMVETKADGKPDNVPSYVNESAYTGVIPGRTNVGDVLDETRAAILSTATGEVTWIDTGLDKRAVDLFPPVFNSQGTHAVMLARAVDNKDRWFFDVNLSTGKCTALFTEHDDAWLSGPGEEILGWLKNGEEIYFASERDGFSHLYTASVKGGEARQLTSGKFEVTDAVLSRDGSKFYLTTSEVGPSERHLYSMPVTGGARTRITTEVGNHSVVLSPDERYLADVYSYTNKPWDLYAAENRTGAAAKRLTHAPAADFDDYPWLDVPIVQVPARDGTNIPARFYKPANYQPGGPAVVFVHGAGYLQNVHKFWSSYSREYMFHHFLMEHGYMVLDMDYRASSGYGRDWRTAIYRHMGGKDLEDNLDGAKWLAEQGADPRRIGIYGGSYGGFITLMAMFTSPDTFAAGAALRPVTDWAHYNHGYTSDILNTPQADEEAYRKSSPIYFAEGLKGALLICHGMVDTNVFFQDSVRLVQRLIELRKENWSIAPYPVEDHGFVQASSWADEYKRIFRLFEENLKK